MKFLKKIYEKMPAGIKGIADKWLQSIGHKRYKKIVKNNSQKLRKTILQYYTDQSFDDEKLKKAVDYFKANETDFFMKEIECIQEIRYGYDNEKKLPYVVHNGKKLFFKRDMNKKAVIKAYRGLIDEQNESSPHLYLPDSEKKKKYGCVVDAGASEGIFSLDIIDQCEKIVLVECDSGWNEALQATFSPYLSKVEFCNKFLGGKTKDDNTISIDELLAAEKDVDLVKMDIEGAEPQALEGAERTLGENPQCRLLICVYHYQDEEKDVDAILKDYKKVYRDSYVIFPHDFNQKPPYFRNGVITYQKMET